MEYSGAGGKLIHEKNQKQKISWHCPFKAADRWISQLRMSAVLLHSDLDTKDAQKKFF